MLFLLLYIEPKLEIWSDDMDRRIYKALDVGKLRGFIQPNDPIVIVTGWKSGSGYTNTMRLVNVPEKEDAPFFGTPIIEGYND